MHQKEGGKKQCVNAESLCHRKRRGRSGSDTTRGKENVRKNRRGKTLMITTERQKAERGIHELLKPAAISR